MYFFGRYCILLRITLCVRQDCKHLGMSGGWKSPLLWMQSTTCPKYYRKTEHLKAIHVHSSRCYADALGEINHLVFFIAQGTANGMGGGACIPDKMTRIVLLTTDGVPFLVWPIEGVICYSLEYFVPYPSYRASGLQIDLIPLCCTQATILDPLTVSLSAFSVDWLAGCYLWKTTRLLMVLITQCRFVCEWVY